MYTDPFPIDAAPRKYSGTQIAFEGFEPPGELIDSVVATASGRYLSDDEYSFQRDGGADVVNLIGDAYLKLFGMKTV